MYKFFIRIPLPSSRQDRFCNSSKFKEKMWGGGVNSSKFEEKMWGGRGEIFVRYFHFPRNFML